jgi:hypothetical protein
MKPVKVLITGNAKEAYEELNILVGNEIKDGIETSDNQKLLKSIKQKIEFIKSNPEYGVHLEKKKIPKQYILEYEVNNLWKVNLTGYWRMLYTLRGSEIEIIALVLDIINHKEYDKILGYKKR